MMKDLDQEQKVELHQLNHIKFNYYINRIK